GVSVVVRLLLAEIRCLRTSRFLCVNQWSEKCVIAKVGEGKLRRLELDFSGDAAITGRRAVKIGQCDRRVNVARTDPSFGRSFGKPRLDLHPVRKKFLYAGRSRP